MEQELHGPSFDARGAAFPGVNLMVQLGHGRDYAWSATTADLRQRRHVRRGALPGRLPLHVQGPVPRDGEARAEQLVDAERGRPRRPPGSETLTAYRTVHGIVYARGTVGGRKVAFVSARTTYFHEADSAIGFFRLNDPELRQGPAVVPRGRRRDQLRASTGRTSTTSTSPTSSRAGTRRRAKGTSPDFPVLGTGKYDWRGYDPALRTLSKLPLKSSARTPSTRPTSCRGTTSRRPGGPPPTTSTATARCTASR